MTVREFIDDLERVEEYIGGDTEIYVGEFQAYGQDFAYAIRGVEERRIVKFFGDDVPNAIAIILGDQVGVHKCICGFYHNYEVDVI